MRPPICPGEEIPTAQGTLLIVLVILLGISLSREDRLDTRQTHKINNDMGGEWAIRISVSFPFVEEYAEE